MHLQIYLHQKKLIQILYKYIAVVLIVSKKKRKSQCVLKYDCILCYRRMPYGNQMNWRHWKSQNTNECFQNNPFDLVFDLLMIRKYKQEIK